MKPKPTTASLIACLAALSAFILTQPSTGKALLLAATIYGVAVGLLRSARAIDPFVRFIQRRIGILTARIQPLFNGGNK